MAKNKLVESISIFETSLSAAEWIWRIGTVIVIGGGGALTGFLAKTDPILGQLGPTYWVGIGILTSIFLALVFFIIKSALLKQAEADFFSKMSIPPNSINPLQNNFEDVIIAIQDLHLPKLQLHENKHFRNCKFVGPGAIAIIGGSYIRTGFFDSGDVFALPHGFNLSGIVVLKNCTVDNCEFIRVTILTDQNTAKGFKAVPGIQIKGLNE